MHATFAQQQTADRAAAGGFLALAVAGILALAVVALGYVIGVLWPRWPQAPVALNAPALPIVVADTLFRISPGAIRQQVQRHPGSQERVDLAYFWPTLAPAAMPAQDDPNLVTERIFVTIAPNGSAIAPANRLEGIYRRYLEQVVQPGPGGLAMLAFRNGTPYQGEDLLFDHVAPDRFIVRDHFLVRCTRDQGLAAGACLYERSAGKAALIVRLPRAWLVDWRAVEQGVDRLLAQLRAG